MHKIRNALPYVALSLIMLCSCKSDPSVRVEAHLTRGLQLESEHRVAEAIEEYRAALRLDPDHAMVRYELGRAFSTEGDARQALEHYSEAIRMGHRAPKVLMNWLLTWNSS